MEEAGADSPHLEGGEQEQAAKHAPLRSLVIHEIIREQGQAELDRPTGALAWSGLAAGLSMGFSFLGVTLFHASLPEAPFAHLVASLGYTIGFVIVVLGRQQLFTESTLTAVLPALTNRDARTFGSLLRLWAVVFAANLIGTWLFAAVLTIPDVFRPEVYANLHAVAQEALGREFWPTFIKAVLAGWLIALMVWLLPSARGYALFVVVFMTYVVALARLSHVVAGSAEAAYSVMTGLAPFADYFTRFLIPTLLGNVVGGVALVAMLNHAPVKDELSGQPATLPH